MQSHVEFRNKYFGIFIHFSVNGINGSSDGRSVERNSFASPLLQRTANSITLMVYINLFSYCSNVGGKVNIELHIDWSTVTPTVHTNCSSALPIQNAKKFIFYINKLMNTNLIVFSIFCYPNFQVLKLTNSNQCYKYGSVCYLSTFVSFQTTSFFFLG